MITIEHLEVLFEAERRKDEIRFAELFAEHIARHESARHEHNAMKSQGETDRSLDCGSLG